MLPMISSGDQKTNFESPWQHNTEWKLCVAHGGAIKSGTTYGFVELAGSERKHPVIAVKPANGAGQPQEIFLSMLVRRKVDGQTGEFVDFDPIKGKVNVIARRLQESQPTDEKTLSELCKELRGKTIVCDRQKVEYKNSKGDTLKVVEFWIK